MTTATNESGEFRFERIVGGARSIILDVEAKGFRRFSRTFNAEGRAPLLQEDITLEIAGLNEAVLVTAAGVPQTIDQTSKAIGTRNPSGSLIRNISYAHEHSVVSSVRHTS
jgi:vitamin B12 transporter